MRRHCRGSIGRLVDVSSPQTTTSNHRWPDSCVATPFPAQIDAPPDLLPPQTVGVMQLRLLGPSWPSIPAVSRRSQRGTWRRVAGTGIVSGVRVATSEYIKRSEKHPRVLPLESPRLCRLSLSPAGCVVGCGVWRSWQRHCRRGTRPPPHTRTRRRTVFSLPLVASCPLPLPRSADPPGLTPRLLVDLRALQLLFARVAAPHLAAFAACIPPALSLSPLFPPTPPRFRPPSPPSPPPRVYHGCSTGHRG